jgi:uncharacterized protein with ATP-grasp and redox domains
MSIVFNSECLECHFTKNLETARALGTDAQAKEFALGLMKIYLDAPDWAGSPWFGPGTNELFHQIYGLDLDRFKAEKEESNRFVLERLDQIRAKAENAADPVYAGLQLAILGNYIDFSALHGEVSFEKLEEMLARAEKMELDAQSYASLCADLEQGKKLLYLTDNAGEIGFDRIFAEQIHKKYPHLQITFCVRGGPILNDATREDAALVGIPFPVIDNGGPIAGTQLEMLGDEARRAMNEADVIISKGQANVETMYGCGYNVYYAFLVKCARFIQVFNRPKLTPMLVKERK